MKHLIDKDKLVAEIEKRRNIWKFGSSIQAVYRKQELDELLDFINTLEVKESDETAEAFAKIIRANLTGIDKDVQYKFEQLYEKTTGEKMYQGFKD